MATIKAYTDIEQSKKLAEFLPLKTANNVIVSIGDREGVKTIMMPKETLNILRTPFTDIRNSTPCWSLAALLSVLDFPSLTQNREDEWEVCVPNHQSDGYIEVLASNPIDACVAMIEHLYELKIL